jgi:hypothetical protein
MVVSLFLAPSREYLGLQDVGTRKVGPGLTAVFAHPVIARLRALAVNPALDRNQLLGIAPVDDPESVLIACAKRVSISLLLVLVAQ